jgi:hypothetical protein
MTLPIANLRLELNWLAGQKSREVFELLVGTMRRLLQLSVVIMLAIAAGLSINGCRRPASTTTEETPDTSTYKPVPTPATEFEQKLKFVRDAHFTHIWVFTRKDAGVFTKEDTQILHTNAPHVVDWLKVGDMKQFIAGSNFPIDPAQLALLQKRYKIEDYSGK